MIAVLRCLVVMELEIDRSLSAACWEISHGTQLDSVTSTRPEVLNEELSHWNEYDYVVVPMLDGELKIIDQDGSTSVSKLSKGVSYFRSKGVNHNVVNNNNFQYSFVEIEMK